MQNFILVLAIIFTLIVVVGLFIPRKQTFTETKDIAADKRRIFNLIDDLDSWETWSAWSSLNDTDLQKEFPGKHSGSGASFEWKGSKMGKGSVEIVRAEPYSSLEIATQFRNKRFRVIHHIQLHADRLPVQLTWTATVKTGWSSPSRILGRAVMNNMQTDIHKSLILLSQLAGTAAEA